jgi:N-acetylneuraminate synthase
MKLPDPYIIAEIGVNHEGDIDLAKDMIAQIAEAGGHAAKFQTYKADLIAAKDSPAYWDQTMEKTKSQHKLFQKYDNFDREDYEILSKECEKFNIDFLSTPFDSDCLEWLMPLMNVVKIASADLTNDILLEKVAQYKKPMILSVGASSDDEIFYAINLLKRNEVHDITILHCMLLYPTPLEKGFLSRINSLKAKFCEFDINFGYSDHIPPSDANNDQIVIARAMGCSVIEKHFTYNKSLPGNDHYHAVDKDDLKDIISRLKKCDLMTSNHKEFQKNGLKIQNSAIVNARRSLYFASDLIKGHMLTLSDIVPKRPGKGVSPKEYRDYLGKKLNTNVKEDDLLSPQHIEIQQS